MKREKTLKVKLSEKMNKCTARADGGMYGAWGVGVDLVAAGLITGL